jgi:hypothetical protein
MRHHARSAAIADGEIPRGVEFHCLILKTQPDAVSGIISRAAAARQQRFHDLAVDGVGLPCLAAIDTQNGIAGDNAVVFEADTMHSPFSRVFERLLREVHWVLLK